MEFRAKEGAGTPAPVPALFLSATSKYFLSSLSLSWTEKENMSSLFILFFLKSVIVSSFYLTKMGKKRRICLVLHAFFMLVFSSKARLHNELVHLPIGGLLWTERDAVGLWLPGEIRDLWILQHLAVPARMMPAVHAFPSWLSAPVTFSLSTCKACSWILDYNPTRINHKQNRHPNLNPAVSDFDATKLGRSSLQFHEAVRNSLVSPLLVLVLDLPGQSW